MVSTFHGTSFHFSCPHTAVFSFHAMRFKQDVLRLPLERKHPRMPREAKRNSFLSNELFPSKSIDIKEPLPEGLNLDLMPKHIAMILDGNRRWSMDKGLPTYTGHRTGRRVIKEIMLLCCKFGIEVLSIFAFSTENWSRSKEEVDFLMSLFEEALETEVQDVKRHNVRLSIIGDGSKLPKSLQELIAKVEDTTRDNKGLHVIVAMSYSGRYDIMQATKRIAAKVKNGAFKVEDINEDLFDNELVTNCAKFPNPDLLIRTSGEQRISNFYLWQLAYAELFFSNKKLPDFEEEDFVEALISFQKRERRYGGNKCYILKA